MNADEFMEKRKRTYYLEDAARVLNTDVYHILKQVKNLKEEISRMKEEIGDELV